MKFLIFLYFTNLVLAANSYFVVRRGIPSRAGLSHGRGIFVKPEFNAKAAPPRRVAAKAAPSTGGDVPKPGEDQSKQRSASAEVKGPGEVYHVDEDGINRSRYVSKGESAVRSSPFTKRPQVAGMVKGPPSRETSLKVKAEGKYAGVIVQAGPGGSGHVETTGDGVAKQADLKSGEKVQAVSHIPTGGAKAEATISRPGNAYAISYESPKDLPKDRPGEIWEAPQEEKPRE